MRVYIYIYIHATAYCGRAARASGLYELRGEFCYNCAGERLGGFMRDGLGLCRGKRVREEGHTRF